MWPDQERHHLADDFVDHYATWIRASENSFTDACRSHSGEEEHSCSKAEQRCSPRWSERDRPKQGDQPNAHCRTYRSRPVGKITRASYGGDPRCRRALTFNLFLLRQELLLH